MAAGLAASPVANAMLDLFGSASQTGYSTPYVALHTGDPGSAGTSNASAEIDRKALTFAAASGGSKAATGSPVAQWASWDQGTETITHVSIWTASTSGTFLASIQLTASKQVNDTDTLNLTALSLSVSTLAA